MLKFLRKYDKWILAVGGSLLMVAFLLPQALQQLGQSGGERVVATYAGGSVTAQERIEANTRVRFLSAAAGPVLAQLGVNEADHWVMLVDEARQGGFIGGPETGREYFAKFARTAGIDPDDAFAVLLVRTGISESMALDALASLAGVDRMRLVHLQAQRLSEPELLRQFYSQKEAVGLHAALIPAESLLGVVPEQPDEADLEAFFELHKDELRGSGKLDFGYRMDPAVTFEWIDLVPQNFEGAVEIDPVEVNAKWRRSREIYPGEFSEERDAVEEDMRREISTRLLGDAQTYVKSAVSRAERDGVEPDFRAITQEVKDTLLEREGVAISDIAYDRRDEKWYTKTDLQATPRVRNARLQSVGGALFPEIAISVSELDPADPFGNSVGDVIGPLRSNSGSLIYARVIEARPAGAPESMEAIREQVVADYRLSKAWEALQERATRYVSQVAARGIATVAADASGDLVAGISATPEGLVQPVTRTVDRSVLSRLDTPEFAEAIYDVAMELDPIGDVRETALEDRVVVQELPDAAAVGIAEVISVDPITTAAYRLGAFGAISSLEMQRLTRAVSGDGPFSFDGMKERLGYSIVGGSDDEDELVAELDPES